METTIEQDVKTITTTKGELQYYRDWGSDGLVRMLNPQTIKRYIEIREMHPDCDEYGVFFAFNHEQFIKGYKRLVELGFIKGGDKVCQGGSGVLGSKDSIDRFYQFYEDRTKRVAEECDPQEVYFYEYNNHECMISWDGDKDAIELIELYWGEETAKTIKRI